MKIISFLIIGISLPGFASTPLNYFSNSIQQNIPDGDGSFLLKTAGCSAFLVANDSGRIFIASARHCFDNNEFQGCDPNKFNLETFRNHFAGRCVNLVASTLNSDIFIFEADFAEHNHEIIQTFEKLELGLLSGAKPLPIQMYGYPGDIRNNQPTLTDHCVTFAYDYDPDLNLTIYGTPIGDLRLQLNQNLQSHHWWKHNCSTYAGNSGGPLKIAGSNVAIGMPIRYVLSPNNHFRNDQYSFYESFENLIRDKKTVLEKLKIKINGEF